MNPRKRPVVVSWSGGKDSALALHEIRRAGEYEVVGLLTTITAGYDRISMHGVRRTLLELQAAALELPLETAEIPTAASNEEYGLRMEEALERLRARGVDDIAFGDLYLEDVRRYREALVERVGARAVFPLWGRDTGELAREFIALGFQAITVCVDTEALDGDFSGRRYDPAFLAALPAGVDPCGENGEFHTFVSDGPGFRWPVRYAPGETVLRDDRFLYQDLLPV